MPATVHFISAPAGAKPDPRDDPFCVGETCYVDLTYRQTDSSTLSGVEVIPTSVTVSGGPKVKITVGEQRHYLCRLCNATFFLFVCIQALSSPAALFLLAGMLLPRAVRQVEAPLYRIWNSRGEVQACAPVPHAFMTPALAPPPVSS